MASILKGIAYVICAVACLVMTWTLRDILARNQDWLENWPVPQDRTQTVKKPVAQNSNIAAVDSKQVVQPAITQTVGKPAPMSFSKSQNNLSQSVTVQQLRPTATIVDSNGKVAKLTFHDPGFDAQGFVRRQQEYADRVKAYHVWLEQLRQRNLAEERLRQAAEARERAYQAELELKRRAIAAAEANTAALNVNSGVVYDNTGAVYDNTSALQDLQWRLDMQRLERLRYR